MNQKRNSKPITPINQKVEVLSSQPEEEKKNSFSSSRRESTKSLPKEGGQSDNGEKPEEAPKDEAYYERLQKQKLEEELEHLGRDNWFTKFVVDYTWIILLIAISFALVMSIVCVAFGGLELSEEHDRDFMIWNDPKMEAWDMLELSKEAVQTNYAGGIQPLRTTNIDKWTTSITFDCGDCSTILTDAHIKEMYSIEQAIIGAPEFSNFCTAVSSTDSSCDMSETYLSFSKHFAATINTMTQTDVDTHLANIRASESLYLDNNIFMETQFTQTNTVSQKARAVFVFSGPIEIDGKRWKSYTDDEAGQEEKLVDFSLDIEKRIKALNPDLKVQLYSRAWVAHKENEIILNDFTLIILSFTFVLIYVSFHLKSIFLASTAMLAIAFSFPISIAITRFIFQISFFQSLNLVGVFVILGISADNVFVFTDSWQQSGTYGPLNPDAEDRGNNFQLRMNYTWRKATKAITTTSLTTAIAFLATGLSKIMPISAFGYFASTLVIVNYGFAILVFPACLIIFERHLYNKCKYRKFIGDSFTKIFSKCKSKNAKIVNSDLKNKSQSQDKIDIENGGNIHRVSVKPNSKTDAEPEPKKNTVVLPPISQKDEEEDQEVKIIRKQSKLEEIPEDAPKDGNKTEERAIEYFFRVYWNNWMNKGKIWLIILVAVWCAIALWRISQFEPAKEALQMLPDSHTITKLTDSLRNDYNTGENDNTIQISFVWGVQGINKNGISQWDSADRGSIIWDDTFEMSSTTNQQRLIDICDDLLNSALVKDKKVTCWVKDFLISASGNNPPTTIPQATFYTALETYLQTTEGKNYFSDNSIGYMNSTLRFMRIEALALAKPFQGYETTNPIFKQWEALMETYNTGSGVGINNAIQTGEFHWAYLATEKEFSNGAITGTAMSLAFAFIVLLVSTLNIITAIYAITSITGIVISVIAFMEILGWTLGVLESLAIVILIGFSVDYVVHLANHYVESVYEDRYRRMEEALSSMGISIFSGAITTIGSGLFLFLATLVFFTKFAVLIVSTITFSLFFALVFFAALNHLIGPQKNQGNLKYYVTDPLLTWIKSKLKKWFKKDSKAPANLEVGNNPV